MSKSRELNPFVFLTFLILLAGLMSYIIPAGKYQRAADPTNGKSYVVNNSFAYIEQTPVKATDIALAIPKGMEMAAVIIFGMFIAGGMFQVLEDTGMIRALISWLINKLKGKETLLVPCLMIAFALVGIPAINSPVIVFMPLVLVLTRSLGFDPLVGMGILYFGIYSAFNTTPINPTSVGVADHIGGLAMFSGAGPRSLICLATVAASIAYVTWYANRVKKHPEKSLLADHDIHYAFDVEIDTTLKMTSRLWLVALAMLFSIFAVILGSVKYAWDFNEISAVFIVISVITGIIGGMKINQLADSFVKGMADISSGALIIGFAYAIQFVLSKGNVIDTIIYALASLLHGLEPTLAAVSMFFVNCVSALLITSGSGQAGTVMPIMFPIGDLLGVTRQVSAQAFLFADGFMNGITPTSGILMGALAIAKIPFGKWLRFHFPLLLMWLVIAIVSLVLGVKLGWQ